MVAEVVWPDESDRPRVTDPDEPRAGHPNQQLLTQVHGHLRAELAQALEALGRMPADAPPEDHDVADVRAFLQRMAVRQDRFSLGAFCAAYCRTVATHHAIEDHRMLPDLAAAEPALAPVVERLGAEHHVIAGLLDALDRALVDLVGGEHAIERTRDAAQALSDALGSHLAYEEAELLGPLGRLPIQI